MSYCRISGVLSLVSLFLAAWLARAESSDAAAQPASKPASGIVVWDTLEPSAESLARAAIAGKIGWLQVAPDKLVDSFKGDAVVSNGRIVAVIRKQSSVVEIHAMKPDGAVARLALRLLSAKGEPASRLERVSLVEYSKGGVCLEATFKTAKDAEVSAKFRIKRHDVAVQTEPGHGAGKLRVECPGRYVVLPDFFADDITLDARQLAPATAELPSENFILHLTGKGDAIAMCVFENRQQDVKVTLACKGDERMVTGSEIGFEGKKIWVALLEAPGIWHAHDVKASDAGQSIALDWTMPFPAQWRVDFSRNNQLTDSWEMLLPARKDGSFTKPSSLGGGEERVPANRKRWNTVLGDFPYPCWADAEHRGHLQPLKGKVLRFQGPTLIYPINRVKQTPLDSYTVVDVMRNTLGVGPCQHILDLEGQRAEYRGIATCDARDRLTTIFQNKQQKAKRAQANKALDDALVFVKHIRGRITRYQEFGHRMHDYLAEQKRAHPELAEFITEMENLNQEIDRRIERRAKKIKTPEEVASMNEDFRKNVLDNEGPDALKLCKKYTAALVEVGDNQDELAGECRYAIKTLRQRAGILMALNPRAAAVGAEIRTRTQEVLRNPASHEKPHH